MCVCACVRMRECVCRGRGTLSDVISECDEMSQAFPTMLVYSNIVGRLALLSLNTKKSSFHWSLISLVWVHPDVSCHHGYTGV